MCKSMPRDQVSWLELGFTLFGRAIIKIAPTVLWDCAFVFVVWQIEHAVRPYDVYTQCPAFRLSPSAFRPRPFDFPPSSLENAQPWKQLC
jgi:hypothetical protein